MTKRTYKEKPVKFRFTVKADYQPMYMESPPDVRCSYHKTFTEAREAVLKHMEKNASNIEILMVVQDWG
jgi:hypothetical protein